jgi:hypothetical protein
MHCKLLELSKGRRLFYVYDTFGANAGSIEVADHRQHRDLFADMAKRSRYFVVDVAKVGHEHETHGQSEPGRRYFEGAAAGAVMIGQIPNSAVTSTLLGWPDAVIPVGPSGVNLAETLESLEGDPERLRRIGRRNAAEAAVRHDWSLRWKQILGIAGLNPTPAMEARERRLKKVADSANGDYLEINRA